MLSFHHLGTFQLCLIYQRNWIPNSQNHFNIALYFSFLHRIRNLSKRTWLFRSTWDNWTKVSNYHWSACSYQRNCTESWPRICKIYKQFATSSHREPKAKIQASLSSLVYNVSIQCILVLFEQCNYWVARYLKIDGWNIIVSAIALVDPATKLWIPKFKKNK